MESILSFPDPVHQACSRHLQLLSHLTHPSCPLATESHDQIKVHLQMAMDRVMIGQKSICRLLDPARPVGTDSSRLCLVLLE